MATANKVSSTGYQPNLPRVGVGLGNFVFLAHEVYTAEQSEADHGKSSATTALQSTPISAPQPAAASPAAAKPEMEGIECVKCGKKSEKSVRCPKCKKHLYCCRVCQGKDWKEHKAV